MCETQFPKGSRFLKINTNEKTEAAALDILLDGTSDSELNINGVNIVAKNLKVTYLSFVNTMAYVVISPIVSIESINNFKEGKAGREFNPTDIDEEALIKTDE